MSKPFVIFSWCLKNKFYSTSSLKPEGALGCTGELSCISGMNQPCCSAFCSSGMRRCLYSLLFFYSLCSHSHHRQCHAEGRLGSCLPVDRKSCFPQKLSSRGGGALKKWDVSSACSQYLLMMWFGTSWELRWAWFHVRQSFEIGVCTLAG